jgi:hypothetical protein
VAVIPKTKNEMNDVMHVTLESISWGCSNRPDINNNGLSYYQVVENKTGCDWGEITS